MSCCGAGWCSSRRASTRRRGSSWRGRRRATTQRPGPTCAARCAASCCCSATISRCWAATSWARAWPPLISTDTPSCRATICQYRPVARIAARHLKDGGSITLLYAAKFPQATAGAIVLAPHILVEDLSVASIAKAKTAYETTDLKQRLAKHHDDPDSAFWGWNRIWLHPPFKQWSIEEEIRAIRCPLLAVQGLDDEYGTLEQIRGIARRLPQTELLELPECGHSPHRDQPHALIAAATRFIRSNTTGDNRP